MKTVHAVDKSEFSSRIRQHMLAYEVRLTHLKPEHKWRSNEVLLCIAPTVQRAIEMACEVYPNDTIINQVVLRNNTMDTVISADAIQSE